MKTEINFLEPNVEVTTQDILNVDLSSPHGPAGPKGDKGDKGDTGATGPKGDQGTAGISPKITVTHVGANPTRHNINISDAYGVKNFSIYDGDDADVYEIVKISDTEPVSTKSRLWVDESATEYEIPTMDELDDLSDEVEGLKEDLGLLLDYADSPNIFTGYTQEGGINHTTGEDTDSSTYVRSDYIPLDTSKSTIYILRQTNLWGMRLLFYNSSKTYLSNTQVFNGSATVLTGTCTIPDNAAYVRTFRSSSATGWVSLSYTQVTEYYPPGRVEVSIKDEIINTNNLTENVQNILSSISDYSSLKTDYSKLKSDLTVKKTINIFDGTFPNSGYIDTDGSDASSSSYKRTDYIPIDGENNTLYFLRTAQPYLINVYFYNSSKQGVGSRTHIWGGSATDLKATTSIPSGAAYIRMYTSESAYSGNLMLSYSYQSEYIPYGEDYYLKDEIVSENNLDDELKEKINSDLPFTGKKIAFMGDSIVGNFNDSTGLCSIISAKTGAEVINCAFGGSRMAYRHSNHGDATPGASGYNPGATDAQKNQVDQYRYWNTLSGYGLAQAIASGVWTAQENAVNNMLSALDYFADRLEEIEAIDWSTIDYVLWEYGTNDFTTDVVLSDSDDTSNLFAFDNAYRQAIEAILEEYSNIQIIPITPIWRWWDDGSGGFLYDSNTHTTDDYEGTPRLLTAFVAKVQEIAREYQMPCIDDYYTMGANRLTRLHFFNSNDGTHPNEEGRERIAEHIASQLDTVV